MTFLTYLYCGITKSLVAAAFLQVLKETYSENSNSQKNLFFSASTRGSLAVKGHCGSFRRGNKVLFEMILVCILRFMLQTFY